MLVLLRNPFQDKVKASYAERDSKFDDRYRDDPVSYSERHSIRERCTEPVLTKSEPHRTVYNKQLFDHQRQLLPKRTPATRRTF